MSRSLGITTLQEESGAIRVHMFFKPCRGFSRNRRQRLASCFSKKWDDCHKKWTNMKWDVCYHFRNPHNRHPILCKIRETGLSTCFKEKTKARTDLKIPKNMINNIQIWGAWWEHKLAYYTEKMWNSFFLCQVNKASTSHWADNFKFGSIGK